MYKKITAFTLISAMLLGLVGCSSDGSINKRTVGTIGGAAAGGLLGTQIGGGSGRIAAIIAGSALGAYIGSEIGGYMDRQDQINTQHAIANTPTYHTASWTNKNGNDFRVSPTDDIYYDASLQQYCRDFTQSVTAGGEIHAVKGKACAPKKAGPWKIISAER